jgi:molecular chaperone GrpE
MMDRRTEAGQANEPAGGIDWRGEVLERFRRWLYELTDDVPDVPAGGPEEAAAGEERAPDLFSLFGELGALRQEVRLQTRAAGQAVERFETAARALQDELGDQGRRLAGTATDLKAQLPAARREARQAVIRELLEVRECLAGCVASAAAAQLPRRPWLKTAGALIEALRRDQTMVLDKIDDALGRLGISPLARIGEPFDPRTMRVVETVSGSGAAPGAVAAIYRQGYRLAGEILQAAEVEVEKEP